MNRDELIIAFFCLIDDLLADVVQGKRLRECGFVPSLSESEVITMEVMGIYLGYTQDKALFDHSRFHSRSCLRDLAGRHHAPVSGPGKCA